MLLDGVEDDGTSRQWLEKLQTSKDVLSENSMVVNDS